VHHVEAENCDKAIIDKQAKNLFLGKIAMHVL
jgi:hypothetical protein